METTSSGTSRRSRRWHRAHREDFIATADAAGAAQPGRHVLAVYAHPWAHSFTGSILQSAVRGLRAAGHSVEIADLYAEGFDPVLRHADYAQFEHKPMPDDVRREQARVNRSDALMFVFPVWWWSFPAMLKGWFDRVWSEGWAYTFTPERSRGLLTYRPVLMLCVAGSRYVTYEKYGYDKAMRTQIDIGVMSYAGLTDVRSHFFYEVDDDLESHEEHLRLAYDLGRTFLRTEQP